MENRHWTNWLFQPRLDGPRSIVAVRLMAGSVFFWEGILKFVYENQGVGRFIKLGMPLPQATASFVGALEIVGGLFLVLGLGTRVFSIAFIIEMLVAVLSTKPRLFLGTSALPLPPVPPQTGLWAVLHEIRSEYAQLMSAVFLLLAGPGPLSLDARLTSRHDPGCTDSPERAAHAAHVPGMLVAVAIVLVATGAAAGGPPPRPLTRCPPDAVVAGTACVDRYEASVWRIPNPTMTNRALVARIKEGTATAALLVAGGARQLGATADDYAPCTDDGQSCADDVYAVSLPNLRPSASITWFQAGQACANAGKRLPTNAEWQVAANGTPDAVSDDHVTTCNTTGDTAATPTGARSACVSTRGAFDMVGNLGEWVAEWVPRSTDCPSWGAFSDDLMCLSGADTGAGGPGALVRGGFFLGGTSNGPLAVVGTLAPSRSAELVGFRCAR